MLPRTLRRVELMWMELPTCSTTTCRLRLRVTSTVSVARPGLVPTGRPGQFAEPMNVALHILNEVFIPNSQYLWMLPPLQSSLNVVDPAIGLNPEVVRLVRMPGQDDIPAIPNDVHESCATPERFQDGLEVQNVPRRLLAPRSTAKRPMQIGQHVIQLINVGQCDPTGWRPIRAGAQQLRLIRNRHNMGMRGEHRQQQRCPRPRASADDDRTQASERSSSQPVSQTIHQHMKTLPGERREKLIHTIPRCGVCHWLRQCLPSSGFATPFALAEPVAHFSADCWTSRDSPDTGTDRCLINLRCS